MNLLLFPKNYDIYIDYLIRRKETIVNESMMKLKLHDMGFKVPIPLLQPVPLGALRVLYTNAPLYDWLQKIEAIFPNYKRFAPSSTYSYLQVLCNSIFELHQLVSRLILISLIFLINETINSSCCPPQSPTRRQTSNKTLSEPYTNFKLGFGGNIH